MTAAKETNEVPVINHEEMEIHEIFDKKLKVILKKLKELQENTDRWLNKNKKKYVSKIRSLTKK